MTPPRSFRIVCGPLFLLAVWLLPWQARGQDRVERDGPQNHRRRQGQLRGDEEPDVPLRRNWSAFDRSKNLLRANEWGAKK